MPELLYWTLWQWPWGLPFMSRFSSWSMPFLECVRTDAILWYLPNAFFNTGTESFAVQSIETFMFDLD